MLPLKDTKCFMPRLRELALALSRPHLEALLPDLRVSPVFQHPFSSQHACQPEILLCMYLRIYVFSFFIKSLYLSALGLSCGMQDLWLWCADSLISAHRLRSSAACGIIVPQPWFEPLSPALQGRFLTTGPPGKSLYFHSCSLSTSTYTQAHTHTDPTHTVQIPRGVAICPPC